MNDNEPLLCVGGPMAGKRYRPHDGPDLFVIVPRPPPSALKFDPTACPEIYPTPQQFRYCRQVFHTPDGDLSVWAPPDQTPLETMRHLMAAYENQADRLS